MKILIKFAVSAVLVAVVAVVFFRVPRKKIEPSSATSRPKRAGPGFIGAAACAVCHQAKFDGFCETAHHLTSRLPDDTSIRGSFEPERATLLTGNPDLRFEMHADADGFFQTAVWQEGERTRRQTERIDIVFGSGKLGQTYVYWQGNELFQLPVSHITTTDSWVNSPGFRDGTARFDRPTTPRCLECHATYFEVLPGSLRSFAKDNYVLGISCERCHGPGGEHVTYHSEHPDETQAQHIVDPSRLSRSRQIELCAQCHAGSGKYLKPPFSFRPGDVLEDYIALQHAETQSRIGVHSSNQLPRLMKSNCFKQSEMTCMSCHDPHVPERGDLALFSQRCLKCHQPDRCGMAAKLGATLRENCIDCHIPKESDRGTSFDSASGYSFPVLRDHFITVYPQVP